MTRTTHVCTGCGMKIRSKRDLKKEHGVVYPSWNCQACGTRVPGIIAEKIKHQTQH